MTKEEFDAAQRRRTVEHDGTVRAYVSSGDDVPAWLEESAPGITRNEGGEPLGYM